MRVFRIVGIAIGVLAGLFVVAGAALVLFIDPNDYRDDIEQLVADKTGRTLAINGELDLKIFPWLALQIDDVALGNRKGFGDEPFLTVQRASVGVKLLPLLGKRVEVSRVAVDGLAMTLVSRGDSENNWDDLGKSEGGDSAPSAGSPNDTRVAGIEVTQSTVVYRDESKKSTTRLSGFQLHTGEVLPGSPTAVAMEFDYGDDAPTPTAHVILKTNAALPEGFARIELSNTTLEGKWFGAPEEAQPVANPHPVPFAVTAPSLIIDTDAETLAPAELTVKWGDLPIAITAAGQKLFGDRIIAGSLTIAAIAPRTVLPSLGIELPVTRDTAALSSLSFQGDYELTDQRLAIDELHFVLDDTNVRGKLAIDDLDAMALSFDLDVDVIDVDRYREPLPPAKDENRVAAAMHSGESAKEPAALPLEAIRELLAKGELRAGRVKLAGVTLTELKVPVNAAAGVLRLGPNSARLFGGAYAGDITLDAKADPAKLSLDEHLRGIDAGAFMKAAFDTERLVGRGDANVVLNGTGNSDDALIASLAGKLDANIKDGAVTGVDLWYELRRARALLKRETLPVRTGEPRTQFNTLTGSANVAKGVARNDDLKVATDFLSATGKGQINIATKAIDYAIIAQVYKIPPAGKQPDGAQADSVASRELAAFNIPIAITGTLDDMKIRPDLEGMAKAALKQEVNKQVGEKKDELRKKLGDKLKNLLGN